MCRNSQHVSDCRQVGRFHNCLCFLTLLSTLATSSARTGSPPPSVQYRVKSLMTVRQLTLPAIDQASELAADSRRTVPTPLRFAAKRTLDISPGTDGTWETLSNGRLWRIRIRSPRATDLNIGFARFWLPEGATLHVVSEDGLYSQGPYTSRDNKSHGQLWTPMIPGDAAVIELFVPLECTQEPQLLLTQVGAGYRDLFHRWKGAPGQGTEGACNIDVTCPIATDWTNEIRSVGLYTMEGTWLCSGTLIANTAGDFRNYFLTANHCGINPNNAASVVVYWNYQSTNCGTHGPGSLTQNQSGATFRAGKFDVDFTLIELDEMPEPQFAVYYSGWDRSGAAPAGAVGIHHPQCDVKAISVSSNALTTVDSCILSGGTNTHWQVIWSLGTTEPGSSGSGLWDPATHKLVGTLSGGGASCSTPLYPDCYGKFSAAWSSGESSGDRLMDWLDPQQIGSVSVPGADPNLVTLLRPNGVSILSEGFLPSNGAIDPGEQVTVNFSIKNWGGVAGTNVMATLLAGGGVTVPGADQSYGFVGSGASVTRPFTFTAVGYCGEFISPKLHLTDGSRDLGTTTFNVALGAPVPQLVLSENFDQVAVPSPPSGWTTRVAGSGGIAWATSTAQAASAPNSAFAADASSVTDNSLFSPPIFVSSSNALLTFRHRYNMETGYDGGALEISIDGGPFTDLLTIGGFFLTNGYNQTISQFYSNPLAGRHAWSGNSGGFITTTVTLPAIATGRNVQFRWHLGTDSSTGGVGWYVDDIAMFESGFVCNGSLTPPAIFDCHPAASNSIAFSYNTLASQTYFLETTTNLSSSNWIALSTNVGGVRISATNSMSDVPQRYFRVRAQ